MSGIRSRFHPPYRPRHLCVLVAVPPVVLTVVLVAAALLRAPGAHGEAGAWAGGEAAALDEAQARPSAGTGAGDGAQPAAATGAVSADVESMGAPGASSAAAPSSATGVIRGTVIRPERPRRRVAERYPAAARGPAREPPPVPPVVHLEGEGLPRAVVGPVDRIRITQQDTAFVPAAAAVPVGTSVAFPNQDPFFHNVFSYSRAKRFDLGRFPQGESRSVVFDEPGYVKVLCEVHQWMRAGILVVESPFHVVVDEDGSFVLEGVPVGGYTLVVTDFDRGTREIEVDVPADGEVRVRVELEG